MQKDNSVNSLPHDIIFIIALLCNFENISKMAGMTVKEKIKVSVTCFIKIVILTGFLYLFICALGFLSAGFKLVGGKFIFCVLINTYEND